METTIPFPFYASSLLKMAKMLFAKISEKISARSYTKREAMMMQIINEYGNMISRICFGYSGSKEEFEDIRQDAYANIWRGLESFKGESSVKTWVYRVTLNTCVSQLRSRSKTAPSLPLAEVADFADKSVDAISEIKDLYQFIEALPPIDKAIFMLWLDEMKYEEIAVTVGMSRNAVATRLHRAKQKIKESVRMA